jgi:hypothetical protein
MHPYHLKHQGLTQGQWLPGQQRLVFVFEETELKVSITEYSCYYVFEKRAQKCLILQL